jgi:hypothetical protein
MILRPESDAELLALIESVLIDSRLEPDTRALLASLFCRRSIELFPRIADLGACAGACIGPERARRMLNELRAGGYLVRAFWPVPFKGRTPTYTSLCGRPADVAIAVAERSTTKRTASKAKAERLAKRKPRPNANG